MKVYMIDDNWNKQKWFLEILACANMLAREQNLGITFDSGFGEDAKECRNRSRCPSWIVSALEEEDAIYLVDIDLRQSYTGDEGAEQIESLQSLFGAKQGHFRPALEEYESILRQRTHMLYQTAANMPWAVLILLLCHFAKRPTMLVSTDADAVYADSIRESELASVAVSAFPKDNPDTEPDQDAKRQIVERWANRILKLVVDPLDLIRRKTSNWFSQNIGQGWKSFEEHGLPHLFPVEAKDLAHAPLNLHRKCVTSVFPWANHAWWDDDAKAYALHECLKTVVGVHSQWMGSVGERPLSLAGAYLVFLLALDRKAPRMTKDYLVDDWQCFLAGDAEKAKDCLPFMASQERGCAERTFRSLHEFFLQIVLREQEKGKGGPFGLGELRLPRRNHPYFGVKLNWKQEDLKDLAASVRAAIAAAFADSDSKVLLAHGKTAGAFFRFVIASQASNRGFGAKSLIRLEDDPNHDAEDQGWLWIGQFEALP